MKIKGKQLEKTLRSESDPFDIIYADRTVGDLNGAIRFTAVNDEQSAGGDSIDAYKIVYITGQSGNLPKIGLADADSAAMPAFGFTASASAYQEEVDVITFGNLKGVDTSALSVGDILYVSTTPGEYTTTPPAGTGSKIQNVGMVVKSDSNGIIKVGGAGRSNATPNLDEGKFFVGNSSNQSVQSTYSLPATVGAQGTVLTSNGSSGVTFETLDTGSFTYETKSVNFSALPNYFYEVQTTSGNETIVTVPYQTNFSKGDRIKLFNKGDGSLRIRETISGTNIDPNDGTEGTYGSYKLINSKALVELIAISTTTWSYVIIPQLELDDSSLTTTGEVFAYNATEVAMKPLPYKFPSADSNADRVLSTNGSGQLSFVDLPSTAPAISYTEFSSNLTYSPNTYYAVPPSGVSSTVRLTLALAYGNSSLNGQVFKIANYSGQKVELYVSDRADSTNDYYTDVLFGGVNYGSQAGNGAYNVDLPAGAIYNIYVQYRQINANFFLYYSVL